MSKKVILSLLIAAMCTPAFAVGPAILKIVPKELKASDIELMKIYARDKMDDKDVGAQLSWINRKTNNKGRVELVKKFMLRGNQCRVVDHKVYLYNNADNFSYTSTICKTSDNKWFNLP